AMLGEQIDLKKLTETQAEYELARKNSELQERAAQLAANRASVKRADAAATAQADQNRSLAERQLVAQQTAAEQQASQQRRQNAFTLGLQILQWNQERALAAQANRPQTYVWR